MEIGSVSTPLQAPPVADVLQQAVQAQMDMANKMMRYALQQQMVEDKLELSEAAYQAIENFR